MKELMTNPWFSIGLSLAIYCMFTIVAKKTKIVLFNPLLLSILCIIGILNVFNIPLDDYNIGGDVINMFLVPATTALGLSIYRQFDLLKKHLLPVLIGCLVGAITSIASVYLMCQLFGFEDNLRASLIPKSVTTPIAIEITGQLSGIPAITVAAVIITGIMGSLVCPFLIKIFKIKDPTIAGVSIGACSHAVGTSKAIELGETQGAMSAVSLSISAILAVILSLLLF